MISLLVVAEIRLLRDGLAAFLETRDGIRVLGTATHHEEALPLLAEVEDAVVLVDVAQPSAVETVRAIVEAAPRSKVVALAVPELEPEVVRWAEEGTAGYVPRDAGLDELEACIRSVARGEAPIAADDGSAPTPAGRTVVRAPSPAAAHPVDPARARDRRADARGPDQQGDRQRAVDRTVHGQKPRRTTSSKSSAFAAEARPPRPWARFRSGPADAKAAARSGPASGSDLSRSAR